MSDQYVQVTPDSTGKKVDTSELTVGANTVERQRIVVADPTSSSGLASVTNNELHVVSSFNPANQSAFGTLETADLDYIFQGDFIYGMNTQLWAAAVTSGTGATVDTNGGRLRIQSGTNSAGYAYQTSRKAIRYRAGQGSVARFTPVFSTGVANNIQLWGVGSISSNLPYDGWFFGFNGTAFGVAHYLSGTPTWATQTSWNGDTLDGNGASGVNWNPTYGTPVMIKYPYLGFGDVFFYVQNPTTGSWILAHTIRYANTTTTPELSNPTIQFLGFTLNSGSTTNKTMYCGSVGIALSGKREFTSNPRWATDNAKTAITTETCILNLQNCTSYNGVTNRGQIRLNSISAQAASGAASTAYSVFRIKLGATIGGSPSYAAINGTGGPATITAGNSIASVDTAGTTVSSGSLLFSFTTSNAGGCIVIDLTPYELYLAPGEIMSFTGFSNTSSVQSVSVNWSEDI